MDAERANQRQNARVEVLLREGELAFMNGDRRLAHQHWREAAAVDPYNESVWLALLQVLESEDDRVVCLENIIAINPLNAEARRALRHELEHPEPPPPPSDTPRADSTLTPIPAARQAPFGTVIRGFVMGIGFGVIGVVIGVIASIVWYGI